MLQTQTGLDPDSAGIKAALPLLRHSVQRQSIRTLWCVSAEAQTWPVCTAPSSVRSGGCTDYSAEMANRVHLTKHTDWSAWLTTVRKYRVNDKAVFLAKATFTF